MDEVFTITQEINSSNKVEKFLHSSSNIYDILDFIIASIIFM